MDNTLATAEHVEINAATLMRRGTELGISSSSMELCHKTEGIDALSKMIEQKASQKKDEEHERRTDSTAEPITEDSTS